MNFLGMTLNMLTLMALSLAIGLLIDDAIVVRENIVRHLERGEDHFTAAREGTSEIGLAVLATTLSIMAVFVPVAFMKGIVGRFFFQFGITVAFAVLVSLFVSFTLDPMLSSRWYDPDIERKGKRHLLARGPGRSTLVRPHGRRLPERHRLGAGPPQDGPRRGHRRPSSAGWRSSSLCRPSSCPDCDQGEFEIKFKTAPDASIDETRGRLEAVLEALQEYPGGQAHLRHHRRRRHRHGAGRDGLREADGTKGAQAAARSRSSRRSGRAWRRSRASCRPSLEAGRMDGQKPLLVNVRGEDIALLKQYAAELKRRDVQDPRDRGPRGHPGAGHPEYRLIVDRERAADAGVDDRRTSSGTVGALVGGQAVSTYEDEDGEAVDVRVRLPAGPAGGRRPGRATCGWPSRGRGGAGPGAAGRPGHATTCAPRPRRSTGGTCPARW